MADSTIRDHITRALVEITYAKAAVARTRIAAEREKSLADLDEIKRQLERLTQKEPAPTE